MDHNLPVVASVNAGKVCQDLGYTNITTLKHNESYIFNDKIQIDAIAGSPVGPGVIENGYILRDLVTGESIYYEPHGFHSPNLQKQESITTIITPLTNIKIPFLGPVIKGQETAVEVCRWLNPQYILSTAAGGDIDFDGLLVNLLKPDGTIERLRNLLKEANLFVNVIEPQPGEKIVITK